MNIDLENINHINSACFVEPKCNKTAFTSKNKQTQNTKKSENKSDNSKQISDISVILSSVLIVSLGLLASAKKGKNETAFKDVQKIKQMTQHLENELKDSETSGNSTPFIQKFGCFWDKLQKNHKELTNNLIYALGVIVVEPFVILASPFGQDKSTKNDKMIAIARLPITVLSSLSFQYSIDKFFSDLVPTLSREGFLGEKFKSLYHDFENLPAINKTKLKTVKEVTVFTLGLLTLPLSVALTNTLYGKVVKHTKLNEKTQDSKLETDISKNEPALISKDEKISFKGSKPTDLIKEISKNANEIEGTVIGDFEPSKGFMRKFYQAISKPVKSILESNWLDKQIAKLGDEGINSDKFQKLVIWGVALKDTVRSVANTALNYYNSDLSYDQRLYMLFYHIGIGVPSIIIDLLAGFLAIKYQDKFLEKMLRKFKFSEAVHQQTKNGLKFFIPVALATIVGKRILAPIVAMPFAGVLKKKSLDSENKENKIDNISDTESK